MPQIVLDTTQAIAELAQLLEEISAPSFEYWPARRRVKRGIFLARAVLHGLLFHLRQWDDSLPPGAEYGLFDPPTPPEAELQRARLLVQQLEAREQSLLDEMHHQQARYYIRAYQEQDYWRSRRKLSLTSVPMKSLPVELLELPDLENLWLSSCSLVDLTGIGQLRHLRYLSVSYNALERLPDDFAQLQQLEWFGAQHNHLSSIEPLFSLSQLRWLNLQNNHLSPQDIARLRAAFGHIHLKTDPLMND